MQQLRILNSKEIRSIKEKVIQQFNYFFPGDYAYFQSENDKSKKDKIFIISKDVARVEMKNLIIDKIGFYLGELSEAEFRLSKEGAQLLAQEAEKNKISLKNVVELNTEEVKKYFQGLDLEKDLGIESKLILLKYQKDVFGCARYKERKILNFLPKIHRGEVIL